MVGPYMACALFSPMGDFTSQLQAVEVARAAMMELFKAENRAETDRAAEIRAAREADLAAPEPGEAEPGENAGEAPTRRRLITGGLGGLNE